MVMKIRFMVQSQILDIRGNRATPDEIQNSDEVPFFILHRETLHEIPAPLHQVEDAAFLFRASKAFELKTSDIRDKFFIENQFNDLLPAILQINSIFHPKFGLIIQTESHLLGVMPNKVGVLLENNHVAIFHTGEVRGIGMNPEAVRPLLRRQPTGNHFKEFVLSRGSYHGEG